MKQLEYYIRRLKYSIYTSGSFAYVIIILLFVLTVVLFLTGCKTVKKSVSEKENTSDSVRIEYREKIVKVPVTVYVEVPVENVANVTKDSTSHLETSFAVSNASMVWIDGVPFLRHDLKNKAQKIEKTDTANVVEKEKVVWKTRRVIYTKTEYVQKEMHWWQKGLMWIGGIAIFISIIWLVLRLQR